MLTPKLPLNESTLPCPMALGTKLKARSIELNIRSAYQIYLNSLACSGRSAIETLLNQSILLWGHEGAAENYN